MSYKFKFTIINNRLYYETTEYNSANILVSAGGYEKLDYNIKNKSTYYEDFNELYDVNEFVFVPYKNTEDIYTWQISGDIYRPSTGVGIVPLHYKIKKENNLNTTVDIVEYVQNVNISNCSFKRIDGLGLYENGTNAEYGWLDDDGKLTNNISILTIVKIENDYKILQFIGDGTEEKWREFKFIKIAPPASWNSVWDDSDTDHFEGYLSNFYGELENNTSGYSPDAINYKDDTYSYDVDSNGILIDNIRELGSSVYYTNNNLRNDGLYTLCDALPAYDLTDGTKTYQSNKVYVLFRVSKTANGYNYDALYSPELFEKTGIGYILSNWIVYVNGELKVAWWPELTPNKFGENQPDLSEYSLQNPLIGTIKCWKDAIFLSQDTFEKNSQLLSDTKFYTNINQYYRPEIENKHDLPTDGTYVTTAGEIAATNVVHYQIRHHFNVGDYFKIVGTAASYTVEYYRDNMAPPEGASLINDYICYYYNVVPGTEFFWAGHNLQMWVPQAHNLTKDHAYINEQIKTYYVDNLGDKHDVDLNIEFRENERICILPKRETGLYGNESNANRDLNLYIDKTKIDIKTGQDKIALFGYSKFIPVESENYVINDKEPIQNLVMWRDVKGQEQLNLIDGINYHSDGLNLVPIQDENGKQIVKFVRFKNVTIITTKWINKQPENGTLFDYVNVHNQTKSEYVTYIPEIRVISDSSEIDILELLNSNKNGLITPMDYYSFMNNASFGGYTKITYEEEKQNWFWLEDLKNWCIWIYDNNNRMYYLSIWNGYNGWDDLRDINALIDKSDFQYLAYKYYYPKYIFNRGTYYYGNGGLRLPGDAKVSDNFSYTIQDTYNPSRARNSVLTYNTFILRNNNMFSTYDPYSFQSIRNSDMYSNSYRMAVIPGTMYQATHYDSNGTLIPGYDIRNGYVSNEIIVNQFTTQGTPPIIRTTDGQIHLLFAFMFDFDKPGKHGIKLLQDTVDDLNNTCINFFGSGNHKTMDDWKNFKNIITNEEIETDIVDIDSETIYNRPNQVNSIADTINMNINISASRPNVITDTIDDADYAIRWNR